MTACLRLDYRNILLRQAHGLEHVPQNLHGGIALIAIFAQKSRDDVAEWARYCGVEALRVKTLEMQNVENNIPPWHFVIHKRMFSRCTLV